MGLEDRKKDLAKVKEKLRLRSLAKEKFFLFFIILAVFFILTSSSENHLITGAVNKAISNTIINPITGAAISNNSIFSSTYLLGLIIIILILLALFLYLFFRRRKKKSFSLEIPREKKVPLAPLRRKSHLKDKLGRINQEINDLRQEEPSLPNIKVAKKLIRLPTIKESKLKKELEEVNQKLRSDRQPVILNSSSERKRLSTDLKDINQKISQLDKMVLKKVKVKSNIPSMLKSSDIIEKKRLKDELKKITLALSKGK